MIPIMFYDSYNCYIVKKNTKLRFKIYFKALKAVKLRKYINFSENLKKMRIHRILLLNLYGYI